MIVLQPREIVSRPPLPLRERAGVRVTIARRHGALIFLFALYAATAFAQAPQVPPPVTTTIPAEESRLSPALFRDGLKKRGLIELLEQHLKEYPPASPSAAALMNREVKLAEFADKTRPLDQRRAAIAEANRLLEQLIEENTTDLRAVEWRMTLAHSLLYQEGEAYATNILFFGGTQADRSSLSPLTARALSTARALIGQIEAENERINALSPSDFEKLEEAGFVEKLDRLGPSADYLLLWALFYDSLHREEKDPARASQLTEIVKTFAANPDWLATPHEQSNVQIPALLLAGMTERRLKNHETARQHFERAAAAAERLADESKKDAAQWAIILSALEAGRNALQENRFDPALAEVTKLRATPAVKAPAQYGARLAAALLERSILLARAESADKAGRSTDARKFREDAWKSLDTLAREEPQNRAQLYATLYKNTSSTNKASAPRDPVEVSALLAGLLEDAAKDPSKKDEFLNHVIREGEQFLSQASGAQRTVTPEILYQMAIAHYRLAQPVPAAQKMIEIAKKYPNSGQAAEAALTAVQLAAQQCMDASQCAAQSPNHQLYRQALETLLAGFPNHDAAKYWRFYYAQLLEDAEDFSGAATEYSRVDRTHEHYLESAFRRLRAQAKAAAQASQREPSATPQSMANMDAVNVAYRDFVTRATAESSGKDQQHGDRIQELLAEARLLLAETYLLAGVNRPEQALETLVGFEKTSASQGPLLGRMWRARLRALEASGRLEEASRVVPEYVAADPRNAGPTLQMLYTSMRTDWQRAQPAAPTETRSQPSEATTAASPSTAQASAPANAEIMLLLSDQILKWTQRNDVQTTPAQQREAAVQHAETHLLAGKFTDARALFETLLPNAQTDPSKLDSVDLRATLGHAEALLRNGDPEKALPGFNRLATNLPPEHPTRWLALIGDLEARTALGHPPDGILRVITQQRRLFPTLGGPETASRFDRIERENIRRRDQQPAVPP